MNPTLLLIIQATAGGALSAINTVSSALTAIIQVGSVVIGIVDSVVDTATDAIGTILGGLKDLTMYIAGEVTEVLKQMRDEWLQFEMDTDRIFGLIATQAGASFKKIGDVGLQTADLLGKDINSVMDGLFETMSGGFKDVNDASTIMNTAGRLAQAGWTDTSETIGAVITTLHSFGMAASEAEKVAAVLFQTQVQGRGTMQQLAGLMGNILPIAASLGFTLEDTSAATAGVTLTMGANGRVMSSVVSAMQQLVKPTKSMKEAWEKYGFAITRATDGTVDFKATLESLRAIRDKFGDSAIGEMFGNQAALRGIGILTGMAKGTFDEVFDSIRDTQKSTQEFEAAVQSTLSRISFQLSAFSERWKVLRIRIFALLVEVFEPVFNDIMVILNNTREEITKLLTSPEMEGFKTKLKEILQTMRESEVYKSILEGIKSSITSVITNIMLWGQRILEIAQSPAMGAFIDYLKGAWNTLVDGVVTGVAKWSEAIVALKPQAEAVFNIVLHLLEEISKWVLQVATSDLPEFIKSFKDADIAGWLAGVIEGFQKLRVDVVDALTAIGTEIINITAPILDNWNLITDVLRASKDLVVLFVVAWKAGFHTIQLAIVGVTEGIAMLIESVIKLTNVMALMPGTGVIGQLTSAVAPGSGTLEYLKNLQETLAETKKNLQPIVAADAARVSEQMGTTANSVMDIGSVPDPNRSGPLLDALNQFQTNQHAATADPESPINTFISFLQDQSLAFQEEQAKRAEELASVQGEISASTEALADVTSNAHATAIGFMENTARALDNLFVQTTEFNQRIQQLETLMTS